MDLSKKSVLVTGGNGFLGRALVRQLKQHCRQVLSFRSSQYDLRSQSQIKNMMSQHRPQVVIHLAANVGGIGKNQKLPGTLFYENAIMGVELVEQCRKFEVEKTVLLGTVCAYPKFTPTPFREESLWDGYPEETNAPYGLAKKMLLVQAQAYAKQYQMNAIYLLPVNLYGPEDNFDLQTSHIIPALIRKCVHAKERKQSQVTLWGDGTPTRDFLYVDDAARGIILATQKYNAEEPVNLGAGVEVSIAKLAEIVGKEVGYEGEFCWDSQKPNGQPRRQLDASRAKKEFGFEPSISLQEGIKRTVAWYLTHREVDSTEAKNVGLG